MAKVYHSLTTDIVIFTVENESLKILLIKRVAEPFKNQWALPGGFILENELPEKAALRVLRQKAGIGNIFIEQLYTFAGSSRDPRGNVISISYFALIPKDKIKSSLLSEEPETLAFVPIQKIPKLAFDHRRIINYALKRLRSKLEYTNIVYSLLPDYFTFNELQGSYEIILGRKSDKRNFRKKFFVLNLIEPTKKMRKGIRQRPARLYKFISRRPTELKKFF